MFLGTHTPKLDEKGRFFLPAKFRDELDDGLVITRGQDRCLAIYPTETFVEMTREIAKGSVSVKKVRDYQRMLAAGASDTAPDKQGRVMIPPMLRRYAALNKEIVVVGAITRVEVWDATEWEKYSSSYPHRGRPPPADALGQGGRQARYRCVRSFPQSPLRRPTGPR